MHTPPGKRGRGVTCPFDVQGRLRQARGFASGETCREMVDCAETAVTAIRGAAQRAAYANEEGGTQGPRARMADHWFQTTIELAAKHAGFHLVTQDVIGALEGLSRIRIGLLHLFIQHTSASLAINENADPDVRGDLQRHFDTLAPRNAPHYEHTLEGPDDMPAHIKSVLIGSSLTVPVSDGALALGSWQGIYLCEHRDRGGPRTVVATLQGTMEE